jgi:hypothetical protein
MDVIRFLESAGSVPMHADEYVAAVDALDISAEERSALVARDGNQLGKLLGGRVTMVCSVLAPDQDDAPVRPEEPGMPEEPDSDPDRD